MPDIALNIKKITLLKMIHRGGAGSVFQFDIGLFQDWADWIETDIIQSVPLIFWWESECFESVSAFQLQNALASKDNSLYRPFRAWKFLLASECSDHPERVFRQEAGMLGLRKSQPGLSFCCPVVVNCITHIFHKTQKFLIRDSTNCG